MKLKIKLSINLYAVLAATASLLTTVVAFWSAVNLQMVPPEVMAHMYFFVNVLVAPLAAYIFTAKFLIVNKEYPGEASFRTFVIGGMLGLVIFFISSLIPMMPVMFPKFFA